MPKVLIASATDMFPEVGRTILWGDDVERVLASTPTSAFEVARTFVPSLILVEGSDLGAASALIRRFREHPGTRRSSVVVITRDAALHETALMQAGANLVVAGPLEPALWNKHLALLLTVPRRLRIRFPIEVRPFATAGGTWVSAEALDVSVRGMLLVCWSPLATDAPLALRFVLPGDDGESRAVATVTRSTGSAPMRIGVRFARFEADTEARITRLLASVPPERSFGRYEPLGLLGEGAMGRVYRAFDPLARRVVAIKTPRTEHLSGPDAGEFLRRFRREAQAAAQLVHPSIVTIHDVGDDYFVMELLEGATLQALLRERGCLAAEEVCRILGPIGEALDYAHAGGIVHRDVKPANIMILTSGRPKIMDFGVAHVVSTAITNSEGCFGSPAYMAPEQVTHGEATAATDVYSLAAVAYEALTGQRPFEGEAVGPVLYHVVNSEPTLASQRNPALGTAFDDVFRRALAKDPAQRFATAEALHGGLRDAAALSAPHAVTATATPVPARTAPPGFVETMDLGTSARPRSRRGQTLIAAAATAAALGALVIASHGAREPERAGLEITSEPAGAQVSLDGQAVGRSPLFLPSVSPGTHAVKAVADGYVPSELSVEAREDGPPIALRFRLQSLAGTLGIQSEPAEAAIRVDGRPAGRTPAASLRLAPGAHLIEVESSGHRTWAQTVDVKPGESQQLLARLEPETGAARTRSDLRRGGWVRRGDLVALGPGVTPPERLTGDAAVPSTAAVGLKGTVTVEFTVTDAGAVTDVRVVESAGELLDDALLAGVARWRYKPAEVNGVRVQVRVRASQTF